MIYIANIVIRRVIISLCEKGHLSETDQKKMISRIQKENTLLFDDLISEKITNYAEISKIISNAFDLSIIQLEHIKYYKDFLHKVPVEFILHNQVIPFRQSPKGADVALVDPSKAALTSALKKMLNTPAIHFFILPINEFQEVLKTIENDMQPTSSFENSKTKQEEHFVVSEAPTLDLNVPASDAVSEENLINSFAAEDQEENQNVGSIVALCQEILTLAVEKKASDIHIEPDDNRSRILFRVNSLLFPQNELAYSVGGKHHQIVSRFKILANCDISETRLPQDGSFSLLLEDLNESVDFRFSVLATKKGERVVMRILHSNSEINLNSLGLREKDYTTLLKAAQQNQGMLLVTGPTGSGKTTTLYSVLKSLSSGSKSIFSVEDPVEYTIDGISQCQVQPKIQLGFSTYLRALLRQDPEIILVGEIRDQETIDIAIKSALTGHLILSTLHTNDAVNTISRLRDLGVNDFLIAYSINIIIAQRLLRQNCPKCVVEDIDVTPTMLTLLFGAEVTRNLMPKISKGCKQCNYMGYLDRVPIFEFFPFDDTVRSMIIKQADALELSKYLQSIDFPSFKDQAILLIQEGVLSISEYQRVLS